MEVILFFSREWDDPDELTFQCRKICFDYTDWYSVGLSESLEFAHFLFHINLNYGCSLISVGAFIELSGLIGVFFEDIRFFDDWNWFSCEGTLVDEGRSFENDGLEGKFNWILEEDNISWNDVHRWDLNDSLVSEHIYRNVVVSHVEDFFVQLFDLIQVYADWNGWSKKNNSRVIVVLNVSPQAGTKNDEQVKWPENLTDKKC